MYNIGIYCSKMLGSGEFGNVTTPIIGPYTNITIDKDNNVIIPVAIKISKHQRNSIIENDDMGNLIIHADHGMMPEALILYILSFQYKVT